MLDAMDKDTLFYQYYRQWVDIYKNGAIREATMSKYLMTQRCRPCNENLIRTVKLNYNNNAYVDLVILSKSKPNKKQSPHCVALLFFEKIYA